MVVIVTGAGSGLGSALARALHEAGASVVLAGRRAPEPCGERSLPVARERIPLKRGGRLEEYTAAVAFLLAPGYANGQVLALDGGLTA